MSDQFLTILSRDAADKAFRDALDPRPPGTETVPLEALPGRILAEDVRAATDVPPFDRSVVDGYAIQAEDAARASEARPVRLALTGEVLACGRVPRLSVTPGTATAIATGAPLPRGADSVVMVENVTLEAAGEAGSAGFGHILVRRAHLAGQNISYAGSDIARGQAILYRGTVISAREIAILAAIGRAEAVVWRKPRIAVLSTGDELVPPGAPLRPAGVYDSNGPVIAAALAENGCDPVIFGVVEDNLEALGSAMRRAHAECDGVVLSGGTSKGAGDLTYRLIGELGRPGIIAHGVALKPGKPLCLAVCGGKPVVALPGFPTSAMFTFHDLVAPVLRRMAGLPERTSTAIEAEVPVRVASEQGRQEFVMVALGENADGPVAHPVGKGSGAVTAFAQADGFFAIDAQCDVHPAGARARVTLFSRQLQPADLTIIGSHCVGLDFIMSRLNEKGIRARVLALGSLGGAAALKRGECDLAPVHVPDAETGVYNQHLAQDRLRLLPGWRRMQGFVYRPDDKNFAGKTIKQIKQWIAEAEPRDLPLMVNRNPGSGTRVLLDGMLSGKRPPGYSNQPRSHNAVATAIAQGRADWGVAIRPVAEALGLAFLPIVEECYDFLVPIEPRRADLIACFEAALGQSADDLRSIGFVPVYEFSS